MVEMECFVSFQKAHRLSTVINADEIVVLSHGSIVEKGRHEQLLEIENGVYRKLVERQLKKSSNTLSEDAEIEEEDSKSPTD